MRQTYLFTYFLLILSLIQASILLAQTEMKAEDGKDEKDEKSEEANVDVRTPHKGLLPDESKTINIGYVLEKGLRENSEEKVRHLSKEILNLDEEDNDAQFWYPQIALNMSSGKQRVGRLWSKDNESTYRKTPTGQVGLEIKDYTVFNWGIDYLNYQNRKERLKRGKEILDEERQNLKLTLIETYFDLIKNKTIESIYKENLRKSSFIYRIDREKATGKKINKQHYFQSRNLYLLGQQEYNMARINQKQIEKKLAYYLNDPKNMIYSPTEKLKYQELHLLYSNAIAIAKNSNSTIKTLHQQVMLSQNSLEVAQKESLPLPKFSLTLGSYTKGFSPGQTYEHIDTSSQGGPGGKNIELKAEINLTWTLTGEGGLFNTRKRAKAFFQNSIADTQLKGAINALEIEISSLFEEINEYERQMKILIPLVENSRKQYDETLDNYLKGATSLILIKEALSALKYAEIQYESLKFDHLKKKLELCKIMGLSDLPGEVFEKLAEAK